MSTAAQLAASRANGARSRGPVSIEGKERSRLNAVKHGYYAQLTVLPGESQREFKEYLQAYIDDLQPADPVETGLVRDMAIAKWRQYRALRNETETIAAKGFHEALSEDNMLHERYMSSCSRAFHRALKAFQALKKQRKNEANEPKDQTTSTRQPTPDLSLAHPQNHPNEPKPKTLAAGQAVDAAGQAVDNAHHAPTRRFLQVRRTPQADPAAGQPVTSVASAPQAKQAAPSVASEPSAPCEPPSHLNPLNHANMEPKYLK